MSVSVVVVDPPSRNVGRRSRFTDENIRDFKQAIEAGQWAWDNEVTNTLSCAYQRAQAAVDRLRKDFGIEASTTAGPVDHHDESKGFRWAVGPVIPGQKRRGRKRKDPLTDTPAAVAA